MSKKTLNDFTKKSLYEVLKLYKKKNCPSISNLNKNQIINLILDLDLKKERPEKKDSVKISKPKKKVEFVKEELLKPLNTIKEEIKTPETKEKIKEEKTQSILKKDVLDIDKKKEDQKKAERQKSEDILKCVDRTKEALNILYGRQSGKKKEFELRKKLGPELFNAVIAYDFYATPPEYGEKIKEDIKLNFKEVEELELYDIGAGLASLTAPVMLDPWLENGKINKINLVELNKDFLKFLKCFEDAESETNIKIINENWFDVFKKIGSFGDKQKVVIISNPPFAAPLKGKREKQTYIYFLVSFLELIRNFFNQWVYVIIPPAHQFFEFRGKDKTFKDLNVGDDVIFQIDNKNLLKKLGSFLEDDKEAYEDGLGYDAVYLGPVKGFKGLGKGGKPRKAPDAIMLRFGI